MRLQHHTEMTSQWLDGRQRCLLAHDSLLISTTRNGLMSDGQISHTFDFSHRAAEWRHAQTLHNKHHPRARGVSVAPFSFLSVFFFSFLFDSWLSFCPQARVAAAHTKVKPMTARLHACSHRLWSVKTFFAQLVHSGHTAEVCLAKESLWAVFEIVPMWRADFSELTKDNVSPSSKYQRIPL